MHHKRVLSMLRLSGPLWAHVCGPSEPLWASASQSASQPARQPAREVRSGPKRVRDAQRGPERPRESQPGDALTGSGWLREALLATSSRPSAFSQATRSLWRLFACLFYPRSASLELSWPLCASLGLSGLRLSGLTRVSFRCFFSGIGALQKMASQYVSC